MRVPTAIPVEKRLAVLPVPVPLSGKDPAAFRRALLRWYDKHRRDLPWRKARDPYRIWLSEIMLQQTRVAAVLEHYRIFLARFPNLEALAAAPEDAVLAAWSGLGYYRRARMLHRCARELVQERGGQFPRSAEALRTLPGIGRYTAAAIASIAFDEPIAVVDGNVERVLRRLSGRDLTQPQTWQRAESLLSTPRPGDFNQAMMELGATVCLPRDPKCPACPVRKWCATQKDLQRSERAMERQAPSPGKASMLRRGRQVKKEIWCVLSQRDGHIRLVQRPRKSPLMPGMWELPQWFQTSPQSSAPEPGSQLGNPRSSRAPASTTEGKQSNADRGISRESETAAKRRKSTAHGASRGSEVRNRRAREGRKNGRESAAWRTFRHSITVTDYTVHVIRTALPAAEGKWIPLASICHLPITGLTRKILKAAGII